MVSDGEFYKLGSGLKEMLCAVCDHAHDRCVKVLAARAKVRLPSNLCVVFGISPRIGVSRYRYVQSLIRYMYLGLFYFFDYYWYTLWKSSPTYILYLFIHLQGV